MTLLFSHIGPVTNVEPYHQLIGESLPAGTFAADGDSVDLAAHFSFQADGWLQFRIDGMAALKTTIGSSPETGVKFSADSLVTLDVRLTRIGEALLIEPRFTSNFGEQGSGESSNCFLAGQATTAPAVFVGVDFDAAIGVYSHIVEPNAAVPADDVATQYTFRAVKP
jgi:hypothetical protein